MENKCPRELNYMFILLDQIIESICQLVFQCSRLLSLESLREEIPAAQDSSADPAKGFFFFSDI